jgi:hypothetical protein
MEVDAWLAPFRRFWSVHLDALERHLDRMNQVPPDANGSYQAGQLHCRGRQLTSSVPSARRVDTHRSEPLVVSMPDLYDELAPLYHLIHQDWDASVRRQGEQLSALINKRVLGALE